MAYEAVQNWELKHKGPRPGTQALLDVILFLWAKSKVTNVGIYNRRSVRGGSSWSLHAVGRAMDVGVPNIGVGTLIATFLTTGDNAKGCGICEVIFNRRRWTAETGWLPYHGEDPHTAHIHIGQTIRAADSPGATTDQLHKLFAAVLTNGA